MKFCTKCNVSKDAFKFFKQKASKDGLQCWCKSCCKQYYIDNRDYLAEYQKKYFQKHYPRRKEKMIVDSKRWRSEHGEQHRASQSSYRKVRISSDPKFKLLLNLRSRINLALQRNSKSGSTIELLGCSIEELKQHLEKQFQIGMTWQNHTRNGWHIDHKIPCSAFDLSKPKEQAKCFHYTNLQPLWADDNLRKADTPHSEDHEFN